MKIRQREVEGLDFVITDVGQCGRCGIEWRVTYRPGSSGRARHVAAWTRYTNQDWYQLASGYQFGRYRAWLLRRHLRGALEWGDSHCIGAFLHYDRHR